MKWYLRAIIVTATLFFLTFPLWAQETTISTSIDKTYKKGLELFDKEKYGAAQKHFQEVIAVYGDKETEFRANAEYYNAICAIELFNSDAEHLISTFISRYPESSKVNAAYFEMAAFNYRQENYREAIYWYGKVNKNKLKEEEVDELFFKKGYSYFRLKKYDQAGSDFYEIKDRHTKYAAPALYYWAHIAYQDKNYETALKAFKRLTDDPTFAPVVPYYITQIYYLQGRYDEVIDYAPALLESASARRAPEIAKIIGDAWYKKGNYSEAVNYLQIHKDKQDKITREDYYQLAYAYYNTGQYDSAAVAFEKVVTKEDKLAQNAYFHLADCYINLDEMKKARLAFEFASKLDYDPVIKEEALFNFAIITYELYHSPFNEAIESFHRFIDRYPNSERLDQAYNYLVMAYMYTNNYKEALNSLEKIQELDLGMKEAYQKVAYYRGLELMTNLHYGEAIEVLKKSLSYQLNRTYTALANYWIGEAYYQIKNFDDAAQHYQEFLVTGGAFQLQKEYQLAHYNLGYTFFKKNDYSEAIHWYRKYLAFNKDTNSRLIADTYNRVGDCYFLQRSYWPAIEYYDKSVDLAGLDADYALFQRGFALGLLKRPDKKIESMQTLLAEFPESAYQDDALYELGKTYMDQQKEDDARLAYEELIQDYPNSSYVKKSLVQLGLIYYNMDNPDRALGYYERVVAEYPGTEEAKNSLTGIKNIYVDMNDVDAYFAYVNSLGEFADVSLNEQDSLSYAAAEKIYMEGDCETSVEHFRRYLSKFSEGSFTLHAHFYMGDCLARAGKDDEALGHFEEVIERPKNTFTEQALVTAARIYYRQGEYHKAYKTFQRLEEIAELHAHLIAARVGQMRTAYIQNQYDLLLEMADKVMVTEKIGEEIKREARFKKAKVLYTLKQYERALDEFRIVSDEINSAEGAEAKYHVALLHYKFGDLKVAENDIFDFIAQNTSQEYWVAKSFILLSDIYRSQGDEFQAKHTLKSIIDNYQPQGDDDDILPEAKKRYKILEATEDYKIGEPDQEEIEIDLKESGQTGGNTENESAENSDGTIEQNL